MAGLPPSQSLATSFAKSFYGIFTNFFPEGETGGTYGVEESASRAPQQIVQPPHVAQPPVVHKPPKAKREQPGAVHKHPKATPERLPKSLVAAPQTFFIDADADSFVCEPQGPQESESIFISASSLVADARNENSMTPYGPAPGDLSSFHRTTFTREQLHFRQTQLQIAERQQQQRQQQQQQQHQQQQQQQQLQQQKQLQEHHHHRSPEQQPHQHYASQQKLAQQKQLEQKRQAQQQQQVAQRKQSQENHSTKSDGAQLTVGELLDQHVAYYLSQHPNIAASKKVLRKRAGCYEINGKDVKIDWEHNDPKGGQGYLVVIDGNCRQAFSEYIRKGCSKVCADKPVKNNKVHAAPKDARGIVNVAAKERYEQSKMEALKLEQAPPQPASAYEQAKLEALKVEQSPPPQPAYTPSPNGRFEQSKVEALKLEQSPPPQQVYTSCPQPTYVAAPAVYNSAVYNSGVYGSGIYSSAVYNSGVFTSQVALR